MARLGISIYPEHSTAQRDQAYIRKAGSLGYKRIFTCLLSVGDESLIKIHFHTNEPWKVLEYCASLGEIFDIVVEDMDRQERGLKG